MNTPARRSFAGHWFAALACTLAAVHGAWAADASTGVPSPEIRSAGALLQSVKARLSLQGRAVELVMDLPARTGETALDIVAGPEFGWLGEAEPYPDRHYPEMKIRFGGQYLQLEERTLVRHQGKDISSLVRQAGVDPFTIADTPPIVGQELNTPALRELGRMGALRHDADAGYLADWTAQRVVHVALPSAEPGELSVRYDAKPGFARLPWRMLESWVKLGDYCASAALLKSQFPAGAKAGTVYFETFVLPASMDGRPLPVVQFTAAPDSAFFVMCDSKGQAAMGRQGIKVQPRVDGDGFIRVLSLR